jgi:hypothetical protein
MPQLYLYSVAEGHLKTFSPEFLYLLRYQNLQHFSNLPLQAIRIKANGIIFRNFVSKTVIFNQLRSGGKEV